MIEFYFCFYLLWRPCQCPNLRPLFFLFMASSSCGALANPGDPWQQGHVQFLDTKGIVTNWMNGGISGLASVEQDFFHWREKWLQELTGFMEHSPPLATCESTYDSNVNLLTTCCTGKVYSITGPSKKCGQNKFGMNGASNGRWDCICIVVLMTESIFDMSLSAVIDIVIIIAVHILLWNSIATDIWIAVSSSLTLRLRADTRISAPWRRKMHLYRWRNQTFL